MRPANDRPKSINQDVGQVCGFNQPATGEQTAYPARRHWRQAPNPPHNSTDVVTVAAVLKLNVVMVVVVNSVVNEKLVIVKRHGLKLWKRNLGDRWPILVGRCSSSSEAAAADIEVVGQLGTK